MANLTPQEYVNNDYGNFNLIRAIRIDSVNSGFKNSVQFFIWIIQTEDKKAKIINLWTNNYEVDGITYKKNTNGKYFEIDENNPIAVIKRKSDTEFTTFIGDKETQNVYINERLKYIDNGPWVITQDPWDTNIIPPKSTPPIIEPVKSTDIDPIQPTIVDVSSYPSKYQPTKLQDDFSFDVSKDKTFVITGGNNGNLVLLPDGTKVNLGELTIVKQEDPYDTEIIKILIQDLDNGFDDLSSEYTESDFNGLPSEEIQIELDSIDAINRADNTSFLDPSFDGVTPGDQNITLINSKGSKGLDYIKSLIASHESGGSYDIYNIGTSGSKGVGYSLKPSTQTLEFIKQKQTTKEMFAVGKYQFVPVTFKGVQKGLGFSDNTKFSDIVQEQFCEYLLFKSRPLVGKYLKGENDGNDIDLKKAVQSLAKEFASLPIIWDKKWKEHGNVSTGAGNKGYYGGVGVNPSNVSTTVKTVCTMLIKSRIAHSGKKPSFIPSYYTETT
jgi:hypothetical protein